MIQKEWMTVTNQRNIANRIYELTVRGGMVASMEPGQFVHIRTGDSFEPLLRRPISIAAINPEKSEFTMLYRVEGRGTEVLAAKRAGDKIDVLGPLGNGFPIGEAKQKAVLIGGGIGVPPLYELACQLNARGVETVHVLGFETAEAVFYEKEFSVLGETHITTVDGTHGIKGFVTHVMNELPTDFDVYYSCGPSPMLKAVEELYVDKKGFLSYEQRMGCGIGACFACVCKTNDERDYVKVCSDGPVFPAKVVVAG
ncbi:dihydroorotate dehydrogenase electron transfer subunit [Planococcus lenghuensis]|uniref:Dihydroorotate dehydrogenase B (NAD(+)), electron transfer subunit n=1 Tax=Planococcus lenghuensis TaxID=2213202 RepID=A0A1Q2KZZ9_9BACL|nr:dihydroorotate dehydrogenase electron transfer subunit [Planococcus lenghuensis]AQQ53780.1 dihydroorotate dehydrogenase electron transfer subunit [Planococcus lenghuensis]